MAARRGHISSVRNPGYQTLAQFIHLVEDAIFDPEIVGVAAPYVSERRGVDVLGGFVVNEEGGSAKGVVSERDEGRRSVGAAIDLDIGATRAANIEGVVVDGDRGTGQDLDARAAAPKIVKDRVCVDGGTGAVLNSNAGQLTVDAVGVGKCAVADVGR